MARRDQPSLEQCLSTLREKKNKVTEGSFENNSIAVQQELDELKDDTADVKQIKEHLQDIKKTKSHTKEYRLTENECDLTDDLHLQRKRGLESLLYVGEIENAFMGVQDDVETRALYLAQRPEVFKAVYRDHSAPATRMHMEYVSAMKESWRWLSELTTCLNTHLHNAAHYQQFCHDAQHLQTDLDHYLDWLETEPLRAAVKTKDPATMATHFRTILHHLLDLQGRAERLCERSKLVFPVHLRKINQPAGIVTAQALVSYTHRQISLEKDEHCTIIDNSDLERWIVQTSDGKEAEVPSIILVIPPPDPECFDKAHSTRGQMAIHWRTTGEHLRSQLVQFMSNVARDTQTREFAGISNQQKAGYMKLLNEATRQLRGRRNKPDSDYDTLKAQLVSLRKVLGQVKPGTKDIKNPTVQNWNDTQSVFQLFTDMLVYGHAYKHEVSEHVTEENMVHMDPQNPPTYISKAYFERAMPSVNIDAATKKTQVTNIQCEMYIHERGRGRQLEAQQRHRKGVKQEVGKGRRLGGNAEEEEEEANFMDVTEVMEETSNFVIVGVVDPRSQAEISVYQAINKGVLDLTRGTYNNPDTDYSISIPEAIHKGYVLVEYGHNFTNGSAANGLDSVDGGLGPNLLSGMDTQVCPISGVIDPRTGEWISVRDAIAAGLLDPTMGVFLNPVTGEKMSLADAVKAGYLMAESALPDDLQENGAFTSVAMVDVSRKITGVLDPRTGQMLSLQQAIKEGIIDPVKGTYTDPLTGEVMSVDEAMRRGLIKGRPFDPTKDKDEGDVLTFQQLQIRQQRFLPPSAADLKTAVAEAGVTRDPNEKLMDKIKEKVDVRSVGIVDPTTNKAITLEEAIHKGIINLAKAEYDTMDGEILPLQEATAQGYIEPSVLEEILKTYQECSVGHLIDQGKFDPETGLVTDTDTGQVLSLETAIANGVIDPDTTFFFDMDAKKVMSLREALDSGRFSLASGRVVQGDTGKELTVTEAEKCGQILASIDPAQLAASAETLGVLRGVMDTKLRGVRVPTVEHLADVEEAVLLGLLNVPQAAYAEEKLAGLTPLQLAVKSAKVEPKVAMALFSAFDKLSLQDIIDSGKLNAKTGKFVRPDNKQSMDLQSARQSGVWNPNFVYCVDNETGAVTSLGALIDQGKFDPSSGRLHSDKLGRPLTLEEAIAQGVLTPTIQPDKFVDLTATLKELIDSGQVNPRSATFVAPGDLRMSLRDALANGFLTLGSKVKQDPETGDVSLERDEDVVRCLVDVKENADWLSDVERAMASQRKPSQRLEKLRDQTEETKGLEQEISHKEPEVRQAIQQAEQLVATSAGSAGGQKDEVAQQVQKLKYNTSDLKLRFDTASTEAQTCSNKMIQMENGLEDFYFRLEETDQWMDAAIERTQDLQGAQGSMEDQFNTFKDFMEEVKSKEDDITKLVKSADDFKDQALDFEREVDAYRKRLQILPTISEEGETGVLDEEIESIEAKFKDISRECAKHIDRLAALVKNKKTFDDLNDKLNSVYPDLQDQLAEIQNHDFGKDPQKDARDLDTLRNIKAELIGQERKLKDLTAAGERLADGLEEDNMTSDAESVRAVIENHSEQYSVLLDEIGEQEEQLDSVLTEQQNVMSRLDGVEDSIADAEGKLRDSNTISLDKEKLANQLQDQRLMNADLSSNKALLERLAREADNVSGAEDRLNDVSDRLGDVERLAESRTRELEEIASGLQNFETQASDMANWLTDSIKNMKAPTKGGSGKAQRAKVHALLEAKEERQGVMKELRETCEQLMDDDRVTDKYAVKEALADVEGKWNDLTELLVKEVSFETVADVEGFLKYLDKAENEINTAEPISVDPETLRVQLRDHNAFHEDLTQRKNALKDVIAKGRSLLHETANTKTDEIESRWDSIENQADLLCQHSGDRLRQLESALPLATHLNENLSEVEAWLEEMEAELKSQGQPGENLEEVKKQHDNLKTTQQIIDDHKLFIDDLNSTGMDLMDLCGVSEATDLHNKLLGANTRYEALRSQARAKGRELAEKKRQFTQEVVDSLDHLLEDLDGLKRVVTSADPVPAAPAKLKNEIDENKAVLEDLERMKPAFAKVEDVIRNLKAHGVEDPGEVDDVKSKAAEIAEMAATIGKDAGQRDKLLKQTLKDANQFTDLSTDILASLRDLKDSLFSQQLPGVDTEAIREQQSELAGIKTELEKAKELTSECRVHADSVMKHCGEPGQIELQKQLEDLTHLADDVNDMVRERGDELRKVFRHADQFTHLLDAIHSWLPLAEHKLASMRTPDSKPDTLRDQMEEIKLFKSQIHPRIVEMQQLNQQLDALKDQSPVAAETLYRPVLAANDKWNEVLRGIAEREAKLNDMQVKVGEVDRSMSDVISTLDQLETDIKNQGDVSGDPKHLETILRKLQLMQSDVHNQEKTGRKLHKAVEEILKKSGADAEDSPLVAKRQLMADKLRATKALSKDAENQLQDKMRQVKRFLGEVDSSLQVINDLRQELKNNLPFGALPETAESQYNAFVKRCQDLDGREKAVQALMATGQQMMDTSRPEHVTQVAEKVKRLKDRWQDTRDRAVKRKTKMEEHMRNVADFHSSLKAFTDWLNSTEVSMRAFSYPSKLVDRITKQITDHEAIRTDLQAQSERMATLDRTGTYLKHFGRKQDTIYVKNLLVGIRLRWKKILRRTDERGRLLQQAHKEDQRFHNAWKDLCDWLDESSATLNRFLNPAGKHPNLMKSDMDELKKIDQIKKFQLQLQAKHPTFFATTRLGRNLKDRCTKTDPERDVLNNMLEELRNKWNAVRSIVTKSQNKLDEALLTSGRVSDALHSLLDWLQKADATLADDVPVLGDLDTVHMLIEQHRNLQQELSVREPTVTTMKAPGNLPHSQNEELSQLWDRVTYLCEVRENKLTDALKLAEEFQEVVTIMREFLPEAEAQLKFRSLPDDEVAIMQMIEKHEKFEEELKNHQEDVDKIKALAEEILSSCHPNAIRFVKYYLTITQTRWDQLLERARARGERLRNTQHRLVGLAQSLEDMLAQLTEYQALLATKERDPVPHDLKVVDELLKEHQEVYQELVKLSEGEDFMKIMSTEVKASPSSGQKNGSNMRLNEVGRYNPRYATLQNKWRTVSRMAIERKKKLQDAYDMLQELESFKNFDFESWRAKYLKWIQAKKFRITDFFRRQDKDGDGFLNQDEFVNGMLQSRFPTNKTELNAVFDIFDREKRGLIDYKDFVDALKPDKFRNSNRAMSDDDVIQDNIEVETSSCTCRNQFSGYRVDQGKYRFGEKQKIVLVRLLNKTVMVRVGGGWVPLEEFILNNDPCKAKGRTNFDLRDHLMLDDSSQSVQTFTPRRSSTGRISPFPASSASSKRRQNDTGYASSTSSAGSGDSSLRRSRITSSMINLSSNSPSSLQRNPDYEAEVELQRYHRHRAGSTGNLSGQRSRTPRSSVSSSGRRTPTAAMERRRTSSTTPRATTPTVAFGSGVPRSRPTTPNSFSSTSQRRSTTPQRPASATPTGRPGSVTPTRQLGSAGTTRHRKLPNAPTTPTAPRTPTSSQHHFPDFKY